jgi:hypothetical protein
MGGGESGKNLEVGHFGPDLEGRGSLYVITAVVSLTTKSIWQGVRNF